MSTTIATFRTNSKSHRFEILLKEDAENRRSFSIQLIDDVDDYTIFNMPVYTECIIPWTEHAQSIDSFPQYGAIPYTTRDNIIYVTFNDNNVVDNTQPFLQRYAKA